MAYLSTAPRFGGTSLSSQWVAVAMTRTRVSRLVAGIALATMSCAHQTRTGLVPRFERGILLETIADESANISIGDLDGDGNLDILLVKGRHSPRVDRVLLGDGRGGFPTVRDLGAQADRSYAGLLVDLDRDGDLDVVISNDSPDPKVLHLNDGTARFRVGGTYGNPSWVTRNAAVADMNGDDLPDILVANRSGSRPGNNYICLAGALTPGSPYALLTGDVNLDGKPDILVGRVQSPSTVLLNDGSGKRFAPVELGDGQGTAYGFAIGDLNRDGKPDIALARSGAPNVLYLAK